MTSRDDPHPHQLLSAWLDEETAAGETAAVEAHLAECEACRSLVDDLRRLTGAVRAEPAPDVPEGLRSRIAQRIAAQPVEGARPSRRTETETAARSDEGRSPSGRVAPGVPLRAPARAPRRRIFRALPAWSPLAAGGLIAASLLAFLMLRENPLRQAVLSPRLAPSMPSGHGDPDTLQAPSDRSDRDGHVTHQAPRDRSGPEELAGGPPVSGPKVGESLTSPRPTTVGGFVPEPGEVRPASSPDAPRALSPGTMSDDEEESDRRRRSRPPRSQVAGARPKPGAAGSSPSGELRGSSTSTEKPASGSEASKADKHEPAATAAVPPEPDGSFPRPDESASGLATDKVAKALAAPAPPGGGAASGSTATPVPSRAGALCASAARAFSAPLVVRTTDQSRSLREIGEIARRAGGDLVAGAAPSVNAAGERPRAGAYTIQIPPARYDDVVAKIRALGAETGPPVAPPAAKVDCILIDLRFEPPAPR